MPSILIIEDEQIIRRALCQLLEDNGFQVAYALSVTDAREHYDLSTFDLLISELHPPGPPATDLVRDHQVPVLLITSYAGVKAAVEAIHLGAADYIAKPFNQDEILHAVRRILDLHRLERQNAALKSDIQRDYPVAGIIGSCPAMRRVLADIQRIGPEHTPVLISGEPGTGKELVARTLHEHSSRRNAPLIIMSCAAIPAHLIEAELFGHERLSPSDTRPFREGLIDAASGGSLFLDEISQLPVETQEHLLQALEIGEIQRPGAAYPQRVDMRLIAATHQDLRQQVEKPLISQSLLEQFHQQIIQLPPLRERGEDIVQLAGYMLDKACKRLNHPPMSFTPGALEAILCYHWPGNVRELENAVERAVILNDGRRVSAESLALSSNTERLESNEGEAPANMSLDDYFLYFVLSNQDNLSETEMARRLGISRKSLWERRQRLGIPKPRSKRRGSQASTDTEGDLSE